MTDDRRTKRELQDALVDLRLSLGLAQAQRDEAKAAIPAPPDLVREADALAACIRALNLVGYSERPAIYTATNTLTWSANAKSTWVLDTAAIGRVLKHLADKYGTEVQS